MAMNEQKIISLLSKDKSQRESYKTLPQIAIHDLGLDAIIKKVTDDPKEQQMMLRILSEMSDDPEINCYRGEVFDDVYNLPDVRTKLLELMDQIDYLKDYGTWKKSADEKPGLWDLLHRLEEIDSYIECVEKMRECLDDSRIRSAGLKALKKYLDEVYEDSHFAEMKNDIRNLKADTSSIRSITVGINVNERFEAESLGLVSVNDKPFKKSGIIGSFADAVAAKDKINNGTEWDGDMRYDVVNQSSNGEGFEMAQKMVEFTSMNTAMMLTTDPGAKGSTTIAQVPEGDGSSNSTFYLSGVTTKLVSHLVKKLRNTLSAYTDISVATISGLIPELIYYTRFAEFIGKATERGNHFCRAEIIKAEEKASMEARGFYNLKLAVNVSDPSEIVDNDLSFDDKHTVYILTGANRGGKTTLTQGLGILFVLAQGGIYVPADSFRYSPADRIFTHFPADEDKTMDLGRLGEECVRFKEIYADATEKSLILLNESFSTTSFEEGYYIARDAIRAIESRKIRTVYNTHMHKLAEDISELGSSVSSIVMRSDKGERSFKVVEAPPEGSSYARDIATKYGVTYEMLTEG